MWFRTVMQRACTLGANGSDFITLPKSELLGEVLLLKWVSEKYQFRVDDLQKPTVPIPLLSLKKLKFTTTLEVYGITKSVMLLIVYSNSSSHVKFEVPDYAFLIFVYFKESFVKRWRGAPLIELIIFKTNI